MHELARGDAPSSPVQQLATDVDLGVFELPVRAHPKVEQWASYFATDGRQTFTRWRDRAQPLREPLGRQLEAAGLPPELIYVAMIESGFLSQATSTSGAAGVWQFVPATGRAYGLTVTDELDERRDLARSTTAAIAYFRDLHSSERDWDRALAAYNIGPGTLAAVSKAAGTRDYWQLVDGGHLTPEGANYVAKIYAAAIVDRYPTAYGFEVR